MLQTNFWSVWLYFWRLTARKRHLRLQGIVSILTHGFLVSGYIKPLSELSLGEKDTQDNYLGKTLERNISLLVANEVLVSLAVFWWLAARKRHLRLQGNVSILTHGFLVSGDYKLSVNSLLERKIPRTITLDKSSSFSAYTGVHLTQVLTDNGVHLTKVSTLQRCPPYKGVHLTKVSAFQRCPPYKGVHLSKVSTLQRCPPYKGFHLTKVSTLQRCPPFKGVHLTEVSTLQRCLSYDGVHLQWCLPYTVSTLQSCPPYRGVQLSMVSALKKLTVFIKLSRCPNMVRKPSISVSCNVQSVGFEKRETIF